jgi:hypothetical protein
MSRLGWATKWAKFSVFWWNLNRDACRMRSRAPEEPLSEKLAF